MISTSSLQFKLEHAGLSSWLHNMISQNVPVVPGKQRHVHVFTSRYEADWHGRPGHLASIIKLKII